MQYTTLGVTDIRVSKICLGTMTFAGQNTQAEAFEQMDYALDQGVNFWDTAELYPYDQYLDRRNHGQTEEIIGNWFAETGKRDQVVLATKIAGEGVMPIRGGRGITKQEIYTAVENSLTRLKTDYIDLYQWHWPQRGSYGFQQQWTFSPEKQDKAETRDNLLTSLEAMGDMVKQGKVRAFGTSNEGAWGIMTLLKLAEEHNLPRVQTTQNEYHLMSRLFDLDMAEVAHHENVGLLAWSPLAMGLLTGKYQNNTVPKGSRKDFLGHFKRENPYTIAAVEKYVAIAEKHGLDPAQMALAFTLSRPFTTASIIGATNMDQLKNNIAAVDVTLSEAVLEEIQAVRRELPMPL